MDERRRAWGLGFGVGKGKGFEGVSREIERNFGSGFRLDGLGGRGWWVGLVFEGGWGAGGLGLR